MRYENYKFVTTYLSVQFISGSETKVAQDGSYFVYQIGIDDVNSGKELVDEIVKVTNGKLNEHLTQLQGSGATLTIYDERDYPAFSAGDEYGLVGKGVAYYNNDSNSDTSLTSLKGNQYGPDGTSAKYVLNMHH